MHIKIYTDGGARNNPGPGAIGVLVCDENNEELMRHCDVIGEATNNVAEYSGVLRGLKQVIEMGGREVELLAIVSWWSSSYGENIRLKMRN